MTAPRFSLAREQVNAIAMGLSNGLNTAAVIAVGLGLPEVARDESLRETWLQMVRKLHGVLVEQGCPEAEAPGWVDTVLAEVKRLQEPLPEPVPVIVGGMIGLAGSDVEDEEENA
jgi:hypothetical protein